MRARLMLLVLICGLLAACSNSVPSPTVVPSTPTAAIPATPTPPLATPSPVVSSDVTPDVPDSPTPENTPQLSLQPTSTPLETVASVATPAPVPGGALTIVALGDSLTEGDGDYPGDGGGFPARLQKTIDETRPGSQVINLGKSGWNSQQMVEGQLADALQAKPNIALVWIGSNDLWYNNGPDNEASDLAIYTDNIDKTLHDLTGAGAQVFIALLDDQSKRPYATSPDGAGLDAAGAAYMSKLADDFNDAVRAKAAQYGATTVDFFNTTIFTDPATLADDGIHPNPAGYDLVAQIWLDAISPALQ